MGKRQSGSAKAGAGGSGGRGRDLGTFGIQLYKGGKKDRVETVKVLATYTANVDGKSYTFIAHDGFGSNKGTVAITETLTGGRAGGIPTSRIAEFKGNIQAALDSSMKGPTGPEGRPKQFVLAMTQFRMENGLE